MAKKIKKFCETFCEEDLELRKESIRLAVNVYCHYKSLNDFGVKDQVQRLAVSVPSYIDEVFG